MYDVFLLSYDEENADVNYIRLKSKIPNTKRIHGISGILNAHKACAKKSLTKYFFVVDGDNYIVDNFNFIVDKNIIQEDKVLVWRAINPVNKLVYGYGGVKLLPKKLILSQNELIVDMTTSLSSKFGIINEIASITKFNTSPFNAWRGAFRECVKLSSKSIDRQNDEQTLERLDIWCTINYNADYGDFVLRGANEGKEFGEKNRNNIKELKKINDFNWLREQFNNKELK